MRIAYIVLTCEKYASTRVPWQLQTMFSSIDRNDIYFLGHTMDPSRRLFSWGAADSYEQLSAHHHQQPDRFHHVRSPRQPLDHLLYRRGQDD